MRTSLAAVMVCASLLAGCCTTLGLGAGVAIDNERGGAAKAKTAGKVVGLLLGAAADVLIVMEATTWHNTPEHEPDHSGW